MFCFLKCINTYMIIIYLQTQMHLTIIQLTKTAVFFQNKIYKSASHTYVHSNYTSNIQRHRETLGLTLRVFWIALYHVSICRIQYLLQFVYILRKTKKNASSHSFNRNLLARWDTFSTHMSEQNTALSLFLSVYFFLYRVRCHKYIETTWLYTFETDLKKWITSEMNSPCLLFIFWTNTFRGRHLKCPYNKSP